MNIKSFLISSLCLLTALVSMQQPIFAAKRHKDSSSSSHHDKKKKCCKKILNRLKQIDNTELPTFIEVLGAKDNNDKKCCEETLTLLDQINETTQDDLAIDQEILNVVNESLTLDQNIERIVEQFDCVTVIDSLPYVISQPGTCPKQTWFTL